MIVSLWGMMGSGKSSLGKAIAEELKMTFVDLDNYIESKLQKSISKIFADDGEDYFRLVERNCIINILNDYSDDKVILATGGGTPCFFGNAELLVKETSSIYLDTPIDVLLERMKSDNLDRPILADLSGVGKHTELSKLYYNRKTYYEMAKIKIEVDKISFMELKDIVIKHIMTVDQKKFNK